MAFQLRKDHIGEFFLVKLGADNLKGARNEELFVASHKYVKFIDRLIESTWIVCLKCHIYIYLLTNLFFFLILIRLVYVIYTVIGDVCLYVVGKDEYNELACKYILAYL